MQRKLALDIHRLVVLATPVGNKEIWLEPGKARVGYVGGRARANWFVGIGSAPTDTTEDVDASGSVALAAGASTIDGAQSGVAIYLVNNLPYIVPLNNGHSHQAPVGFIDAAIQNAVEGMRGFRVTEEG
jgi:hypothetical protein